MPKQLQEFQCPISTVVPVMLLLPLQMTIVATSASIIGLSVGKFYLLSTDVWPHFAIWWAQVIPDLRPWTPTFLKAPVVFFCRASTHRDVLSYHKFVIDWPIEHLLSCSWLHNAARAFHALLKVHARWSSHKWPWNPSTLEAVLTSCGFGVHKVHKREKYRFLVSVLHAEPTKNVFNNLCSVSTLAYLHYTCLGCFILVREHALMFWQYLVHGKFYLAQLYLFPSICRECLYFCWSSAITLLFYLIKLRQVSTVCRTKSDFVLQPAFSAIFYFVNQHPYFTVFRI